MPNRFLSLARYSLDPQKLDLKTFFWYWIIIKVLPPGSAKKWSYVMGVKNHQKPTNIGIAIRAAAMRTFVRSSLLLFQMMDPRLGLHGIGFCSTSCVPSSWGIQVASTHITMPHSLKSAASGECNHVCEGLHRSSIVGWSELVQVEELICYYYVKWPVDMQSWIAGFCWLRVRRVCPWEL